MTTVLAHTRDSLSELNATDSTRVCQVSMSSTDALPVYHVSLSGGRVHPQPPSYQHHRSSSSTASSSTISTPTASVECTDSTLNKITRLPFNVLGDESPDRGKYLSRLRLEEEFVNPPMMMMEGGGETDSLPVESRDGKGSPIALGRDQGSGMIYAQDPDSPMRVERQLGSVSPTSQVSRASTSPSLPLSSSLVLPPLSTVHEESSKLNFGISSWLLDGTPNSALQAPPPVLGPGSSMEMSPPPSLSTQDHQIDKGFGLAAISTDTVTPLNTFGIHPSSVNGTNHASRRSRIRTSSHTSSNRPKLENPPKFIPSSGHGITQHTTWTEASPSTPTAIASFMPTESPNTSQPMLMRSTSNTSLKGAFNLDTSSRPSTPNSSIASGPTPKPTARVGTKIGLLINRLFPDSTDHASLTQELKKLDTRHQQLVSEIANRVDEPVEKKRKRISDLLRQLRERAMEDERLEWSKSGRRRSRERTGTQDDWMGMRGAAASDASMEESLEVGEADDNDGKDTSARQEALATLTRRRLSTDSDTSSPSKHSQKSPPTTHTQAAAPTSMLTEPGNTTATTLPPTTSISSHRQQGETESYMFGNMSPITRPPLQSLLTDLAMSRPVSALSSGEMDPGVRIPEAEHALNVDTPPAPLPAEVQAQTSPEEDAFMSFESEALPGSNRSSAQMGIPQPPPRNSHLKSSIHPHSDTFTHPTQSTTPSPREYLDMSDQRISQYSDDRHHSLVMRAFATPEHAVSTLTRAVKVEDASEMDMDAQVDVTCGSFSGRFGRERDMTGDTLASEDHVDGNDNARSDDDDDQTTQVEDEPIFFTDRPKEMDIVSQRVDDSFADSDIYTPPKPLKSSDSRPRTPPKPRLLGPIQREYGIHPSSPRVVADNKYKERKIPSPRMSSISISPASFNADSLMLPAEPTGSQEDDQVIPALHFSMYFSNNQLDDAAYLRHLKSSPRGSRRNSLEGDGNGARNVALMHLERKHKVVNGGSGTGMPTRSSSVSTISSHMDDDSEYQIMQGFSPKAQPPPLISRSDHTDECFTPRNIKRHSTTGSIRDHTFPASPASPKQLKRHATLGSRRSQEFDLGDTSWLDTIPRNLDLYERTRSGGLFMDALMGMHDANGGAGAFVSQSLKSESPIGIAAGDASPGSAVRSTFRPNTADGRMNPGSLKTPDIGTTGTRHRRPSKGLFKAAEKFSRGPSPAMVKPEESHVVNIQGSKVVEPTVRGGSAGEERATAPVSEEPSPLPDHLSDVQPRPTSRGFNPEPIDDDEKRLSDASMAANPRTTITLRLVNGLFILALVALFVLLFVTNFDIYVIVGLLVAAALYLSFYLLILRRFVIAHLKKPSDIEHRGELRPTMDICCCGLL